MSLKEIIVCKYKNCNKIYTDDVILPCAKRVCKEHIEEMTIKTEDETKIPKNSKNTLACIFCFKPHSIPNEGFPSDDLVKNLLKINYNDKHEEAKNAFKNLREFILRLKNFDKIDYLNEYFNNIQYSIQLEKDALEKQLEDYYENLFERLEKLQCECLSFVLSNDSFNKKKFVDDVNIKLENTNFEMDLLTWNGNDQKWLEIKSECEKLNQQLVDLKKKFDEELFNNRRLFFESNKKQINLNEICGQLKDTIFELTNNQLATKNRIDSIILDENNQKCLNNLFLLHGLFKNSKFNLIYRASSNGFSSDSFHRQCNKAPRTLTIIKSSNFNIFGGYTNASWGSKKGYIYDPNAFIFSLVNKENQPSLIRCKNHLQAIYNDGNCGPIFGNYDILIKNNSNQYNGNKSNLGASYNSVKGKNYLAGSYTFQTSNIEVFEVVD